MTTEFAFLFGAGASKALGMHVKPCTPPLMRELYDELAKAFPKEWGVGSPLERYRDQFKNDFEQTYTEVVLKNTNEYALPGPALSLLEGQKPLALYFSRFVLDGTRMRSEEHTSELQSHSDLHSFPTRRSSDLRPSRKSGEWGALSKDIAINSRMISSRLTPKSF